MNLIFSILVLSFIWLHGFSIYSPGNRIILASEISGDFINQPADEAGLKTGDRIIKVEGTDVDHFQDLRENISVNPDKTITLTVERDNKEKEINITPALNKSTGAGRIGVYPWIDPVVAEVTEGSSADIAGLEKGDIIFEAEGSPVSNQMDFYKLLNTKPNYLSVRFKRGSEIKTAKLIFSYNDEGITDPGFMFNINTYRTPEYSFSEAFVKGTFRVF